MSAGHPAAAARQRRLAVLARPLPPAALCRSAAEPLPPCRHRRAADATDIIDRKQDAKTGRWRYYVHYVDCEPLAALPLACLVAAAHGCWRPLPSVAAPVCCCCTRLTCAAPLVPAARSRQAAGRVGAAGAAGSAGQGLVRRRPAPRGIGRRQRRPGGPGPGRRPEDDAAPEAAVHGDPPRAGGTGGAAAHRPGAWSRPEAGILADGDRSGLQAGSARACLQLPAARASPTGLPACALDLWQHLEKEHQEKTKVKNIQSVELGRHEMDTWYYRRGRRGPGAGGC